MVNPNSFMPIWWKRANYSRRRSLKIDQMSEIYRRETRKNSQLDIYERPTRQLEVRENIFQRPTRQIEVPKSPSIFRRPTRRIEIPNNVFHRKTCRIAIPDNIFQRKTCKINAPQPHIIPAPSDIFRRPKSKIQLAQIYERPTRKLVSPNIFGRPTRKNVPQLSINHRPTCRIVETDNDGINKIVKKRSDARIKKYVRFVNGDRSIDRMNSENEPATIFYNGFAFVNRIIELSRGTYYDIYDRNRQFSVDDFKEGGKYVKHHFLTRFHPEQYAGLTEKFSRYIYASQITAYHVREVLKVDGALLRILNPDVPIIVDGVEITAINVPSYPGALMILFKTKNGKSELHGGYMYTSAELEENQTLWNAEIDALIIHKHQQIFSIATGSWDEAIYREELTNIIDDYMETQRNRGLVGLIVFNSHKDIYSMEKFFASFAQSYGLVWVDDECKHLINGLKMEDGNVTKMLASSPEEARIHFVPDEKCEMNNLLAYLGHMDHAHHMLVFRVCFDKTMDVSLKRPCHDRFPLKVYNIPNVFVTDNDEYQRLARFIQNPKSPYVPSTSTLEMIREASPHIL